MKKETHKQKISWWQWLLMLALAVLLLYFAFKGIKWQDFIQGIKSCNFWWIGAVLIISIVPYALRALRWRLLMLPINKDITFLESFDAVNVMSITNFAIPRGGEIARCGVIAATKKMSFEKALGTVIVERAFDILTLFVVIIGIVIGSDAFRKFISEKIFGLSSNSGHATYFWLIILGITFLAAMLLFLITKNRQKLENKKAFTKLYKILDGLKDGLLSGFRMKRKWEFFLYTALMWICYWLMSLFSIYAFPQINDLHLGGMDAACLMVTGSLGWLVPVQGGIGAYHFIISLALTYIYGIEHSIGIVFATISHETQAFTMLLCGTLSLVHISISKRKTNKLKNYN